MHLRPAMKIVFALMAALSASSAHAQTNSPPRHQSRTETGVDINSGSFSFEEQDLSVGGEGIAGLTLTRSYNSSVSDSGSPFVSASWTHSLNINISISQLPNHPDFPPPQTGWPLQDVVGCVYNIAGGPKSVGFYLENGWTTGCGPYNANYVPMSPSGSSLEYVLNGGQYRYRFTGADGTIINFDWGASYYRATDVTYPDGTRLDYTYSPSLLKSVFSNRGWSILFESATKVCAVNTAQTYVTATSTCPANAQTVTYTTVASPYTGITSRTKGGETRQYQYTSNGHVNCIIEPGQTSCRIQNTYYNCEIDPQHPNNAFNVRLRDPVVSQTDGSGRTYTYAYSQDKCPWTEAYAASNPDYRPFTETTTAMTQSGVSGTSVALTSPQGHLTSFTDPLGRLSAYGYQDPTTPYGYFNAVEAGELIAQAQPEGNGYGITSSDARGNPLTTTIYPKTNSGLANLTTTAVYPATCTNRKTCNKPTSVTDAKGNTTEFTYDANSGSVLTQTAPADANGVQSVKRFAYVQRAAWIKNSGGTHTASSYPVWLLSEQRTCRATATVNGACAGGSADEVVTTYDYGPNSGPNNLLVRGIAVAADGQTLRTCFTYDQDGHKLSETKPLGTGATCP